MELVHVGLQFGIGKAVDDLAGRKDRARVQIGRISSFGLLEMSRQRLRESSVQWNISLTNQSFAQKIIKLIEVKAINSKAKIVNASLPEKIKSFVSDLIGFEKIHLNFLH